MSIFDQISVRIIKEQELIIGPLAWEEAKKVQGLSVDPGKGEAEVQADPSLTLDKLVGQYERLFGLASREACKDAVQDLLAELPKEQVPASLR